MQPKPHSIRAHRRFFQLTAHWKTSGIARSSIATVILFLLLGLGSVRAEGLPGDSVAHRQRFGIFSGYGTQAVFPKVTYAYAVVFIEGQYSYRLLQYKGWGLELLALPQYNFTKYRPIDNIATTSTGYEAGLNIGITIDRALLKERLFIYALLSAGPHYVSGTPPRQISGFIFSDNVGGGARVKLSKSWMLDLRVGYRHISNANLASPNGGIDGLTAKMGLTVIIP